LTDFRQADFSSLPAPEDDGAADHLPGRELPDWLPRADTLVAFVYPMTGTPGRALPEGWDEIPGARGCTPQTCAFRDRQDELAGLGATLVGISAMPADDQREFAEREGIGYELVNDSELRLAEELGLPTFEADGATLLQAPHDDRPRRPDREGLLPRLPAGPKRGRRGGLAAREPGRLAAAARDLYVLQGVLVGQLVEDLAHHAVHVALVVAEVVGEGLQRHPGDLQLGRREVQTVGNLVRTDQMQIVISHFAHEITTAAS